MLYIVLGALFTVIIVQNYMIISERKHVWKREKDLLNRIMAKDYETYASFEVSNNNVDDIEKLTPEEYLERYGENGIPVI